MILFDERVAVLECGLSDDCFVYMLTEDTIFLYDRDNEKKRCLSVGKPILSVRKNHSNKCFSLYSTMNSSSNCLAKEDLHAYL